MASRLPTPAEFRTIHGDPATWCGPEIDEYLDDCLAVLPAPNATIHLLPGGTPRAGKTSLPTAATAA
ncbi:hypothetical protein [Streptomyces hydrogenans]|uniref:hypothetical protein n=1 Tax=Streptomyces hydrogenans TaxID=1873719 RepID=UPI0036E5D781